MASPNRQSDSFETFAYLDGGVIAKRWKLSHMPNSLDVVPFSSSSRLKYVAAYDTEGKLEITLSHTGTDYTHKKLTDIRITPEENTNAARLLLALASFMLETGNLDAFDIADALSPRRGTV